MNTIDQSPPSARPGLPAELREHLHRTAALLDSETPRVATIEHRAKVRDQRRAGGLVAAAAVVVLGVGLTIGSLNRSQDVFIATPDPTPAPTLTTPTIPDTDGSRELPPDTGPGLALAETSDLPAGVRSANGSLLWSGSHFVALSSAGEFGLVDGLITSPDGTNWTATDVPFSGTSVSHLASSGDRIVVASTDVVDPEAVDPTFGETSIWHSADLGASWTRSEIPGPGNAEPDSEYLVFETTVSHVETNSEAAIVNIGTSLSANFDQLLVDQGAVSLTDEIVSIEIREDRRSLTVLTEAEEPILVDLAEAGLTESDIALLADDDVFGAGSSELYELIDESLIQLGAPADVVSDTASNDEFFFVQSGGAIWRSTDGSTWQELPSAPDAAALQLVAGGTFVGLVPDFEPGTPWGSSDGGRTWSELTDIRGAVELAPGPAGLMATFIDESDSGADEPETPLNLEKDGFGVTIDESGLTVVDLDSGETALRISAEELDNEEAEEVVVVDEETINLLDPDTGEILVVITSEEIEEARGETATASYPEVRLAWSADGGRTWAWTTAADSFGSNGVPSVVVGADRVLMILSEIDSNSTRTVIGTPS